MGYINSDGLVEEVDREQPRVEFVEVGDSLHTGGTRGIPSLQGYFGPNRCPVASGCPLASLPGRCSQERHSDIAMVKREQPGVEFKEFWDPLLTRDTIVSSSHTGVPRF